MITNKEKQSHQAFPALPGSDPYPSSLLETFAEKREKLGSTYRPRTRHINSDGTAQYTNRLFLETSPYLLQHAHNPVNWFPWGDEAFEQAKALNRPVLVSIGYSTCHWCHVMEEESFEDPEIAEALNRQFVCIKVDREERPDVDAIYMKAVQAMTGSGGWPLNVMVTPERIPFWGGTYFPARDADRGASYGFLTILQRIGQVYRQSPQEIERTSSQLLEAIKHSPGKSAGHQSYGVEQIDGALSMFKQVYDHRFGGLQGAPKFPSNLPVRLFLRSYKRTRDSSLLEMVTQTLEKMAAGGMYDQVGGGFHRYATDTQWLVPHFEKMLYDNALLVIAYLEAFQATQKETFRRTAMEILDYVIHEMTSPEGAFYSATDADSQTETGDAEEGYYFTWDYQELTKILSREQLECVEAHWGVTPGGNFEGRNILHVRTPLSTLAKQRQVPEQQLRDEIGTIKQKLYDAREKRARPLRDEKIIVSWNSMMISAFAFAAAVTGEKRYLDAALTAADFVRDQMFVNGRLYRTFKDQEVKHKAFLNDYACYIGACLDLYQTTQDSAWLLRAIELDQYLEAHFEDKENGGFFMTATDQERLITREKPGMDGAIPSGNAFAIHNLLRLETLTLDDSYRKRYERALGWFLGDENANLAGYAEMLAVVESQLAHPAEIVIVSDSKTKAKPFLEQFHRKFLPHAQLVLVSDENGSQPTDLPIPHLAERKKIDQKTTAYICEQGTCHAPVSDLTDFQTQLDSL